MRLIHKIVVLTLAFAVFAMAAGKYTLIISTPSLVGNIKLDPGNYTLEMRGAIAVFANQEKGTSFTTQAKSETVESKYEATSAETTKEGAMNRIHAIRLGGATTRLTFD